MDAENRNHDEMAEMAAAYALRALDPEDERRFEAHLSGCPECQASVREMHGVVALLPHVVEPVEPPPSVKQALFERIRAEQQSPAAAVPTRPAARPQPRPSGGWLRWLTGGRLALAGSLASLVLAVGLGALALQQRTQIENLQTRLAQQETLLRRAGRERARLEALQSRLSQQETLQRLATAPGGRVAMMRQDGLSARLYAAPDSEQAYIVIDGLPEPEGNRDYQIWLSPSAENLQPVSAGVFNDNTGRWVIEAERPITAYEWIGVTQEPDGGSPQPTSDPLMGGPL